MKRCLTINSGSAVDGAADRGGLQSGKCQCCQNEVLQRMSHDIRTPINGIRGMDRPDAATVPIIAMTANAFADDRQKAQEAGMNEHVTKLLESGLLLRTIKEQIQARR